MSLAHRLPPRCWYSDPARHRRTAMTPRWPCWVGEGSPCLEPSCPGVRQTYKSSPTDTGLDTAQDWSEQLPAEALTHDLTCGGWICDGPARHQGYLPLAEVRTALEAL